MTKAQAKKEVQKLLTQAEGLLDDAAKLMDEHQFTTTFMDRVYFPRNMQLVTYDDGQEEDESDDGYTLMRPKDDDMSWMYFYRSDYDWLAGEWKSSSEYKSC